MRRYVMALVTAILVLGAALPAAAQDMTIVSQVNDDAITRAAFDARVRLVRWQYLNEIETLFDATGGNLQITADYVNTHVAALNDPVQLGDDVLHEMEEERLLWQTGQQLNLIPTAEETQAQIDGFFSRWTNIAVDQLAANAQAQTFIANWYASATTASGMTADDIHALFANEALRSKLYAHLAESVPKEETAVQTRHILCSFHPDNPSDMTPPTEEQRATAQKCIQAAQLRLANGEDFSVVAADLSADSASAVQGGNVGWSLLSFLSENYANAARDAALNTVIGPVETEYGLHLIEVMDRKMQTLTDQEFQDSVDGYFRLWVQSLWDAATVERSPDWNTSIPTDPAVDTLAPSILEAIDKLSQ